MSEKERIIYYTTACNFCCESFKNNDRCLHCLTVAYCSKECQQQDWPIHQLMCHSLLDARLRAFCRLLVKYPTPSRRLLSFDTLTDVVRVDQLSLTSDGKKSSHWIHVFMMDYAIGTQCVLCQTDIIDYGSDYEHGDRTKYVSFEDHKYKYDRCPECIKTDKLLCPNTLKEKSLCRTTHSNTLIPIFLLTLFMNDVLDVDIRSYILSILMSTMQCTGCK